MPRPLTFGLVAGLIALGTFVLAMMPEPRGGPGLWEFLFAGAMFGTLFGVATLAAAWSAWGPLALLIRVPLAVVLIVVVVAAILANKGPGLDAQFFVAFGAAMLGQWVLVQTPLWLLSIMKGLRLRHVADLAQTGGTADHQFGIRQLMILTAIVAVTLGVGRMLVGTWKWEGHGPAAGEIALVFSFLVLCNTLATLPLVVAALLPRNALAACLVGIGFVALVTLCEVPAFELVRPSGASSDDTAIFWIMNFVAAGWVLVSLGILRLGGYRLATQARRRPAFSPGATRGRIATTQGEAGDYRLRGAARPGLGRDRHSWVRSWRTDDTRATPGDHVRQCDAPGADHRLGAVATALATGPLPGLAGRGGPSAALARLL